MYHEFAFLLFAVLNVYKFIIGCASELEHFSNSVQNPVLSDGEVEGRVVASGILNGRVSGRFKSLKSFYGKACGCLDFACIATLTHHAGTSHFSLNHSTDFSHPTSGPCILWPYEKLETA